MVDPIKEAFQKIKKDMDFLKNEIISLKTKLNSIKNTQNITTQTSTQTPHPTNRQTDNSNTSTHIPTHKKPLEPLYTSNSNISTGNKGVPTDKQTNRQTNQQTQNYTQDAPNRDNNDFQKARKMLDSLDTIKKEIRIKFKRLTPQEMLVFSTIYSFQEQNFDEITYKTIANHLNLSESSIRDYTNRLIKKGIPLQKIKQNNKKILLQISSDLQKVATLSTIIRLREL